MEFNSRTKVAIENALQDLLREMPFRKITVLKILEKCGCSRPTFYYHFRDKYEVVASIYNRLFTPIVHQYPSVSWTEMVTRIYECLNENYLFARRTLDYSEQGPVVSYLIEYDSNMYKNYILKDRMQRDGTPVVFSELLQFEIRFHSMACVGMMAYWLQKEDRDPPEKMAEKLFRSMPADLRALIV